MRDRPYGDGVQTHRDGAERHDGDAERHGDEADGRTDDTTPASSSTGHGISRRAALGASVAALTTLAGCSALSGGDDGPDRSYDAEALRAVPGESIPTPPSTLPISVPSERVTAHEERTRTLLDSVPSDPSLPNGRVTQRIADEREQVASELAEGVASDVDAGTVRLGRWRHVREDAAEVAGQYRAATDDISREAVRATRERLRRSIHEFQTDWEYAAPDPAAAVALHEEVELLVGTAERATRPRRQFPANPAADVRLAANLVAELEGGRAALADAAALVTAMRTAGDDLAGHRPQVAAAASRLDRVVDVTHERVRTYVDPEGADPNSFFERDLSDTPAVSLFQTAREDLTWRRDDLQSALERGHAASAVREAAFLLTGYETLADVVDTIESEGAVSRPPADAGEVEARRERAVDALESAWDATPHAVSRWLARRAAGGVRDADRRLREADGTDVYTVDRAAGAYGWVRLFAETIPETAAFVGSVLADPDVATPGYGGE
jgi:hypothetical protein